VKSTGESARPNAERGAAPAGADEERRADELQPAAEIVDLYAAADADVVDRRGPDRRRHCEDEHARSPEPEVRRHGLAERHRERCHRARIDHEEAEPADEEAGGRMPPFPQIHVVAPGPREHGAELGVG